MKQTIAVKLELSLEQANALRLTMEAFNRGCDYVAAVAFQKRLANKIAIQPTVYGTLRSEFGLSSQMTIRCIAKAIEAYKRDKSIQPTFIRTARWSTTTISCPSKASPMSPS